MTTNRTIQVRVLGSGCARCKQLYAVAEEAARESGLACDLGKITDLKEIMSYGVMSTPALVVDGAVCCTGRVPAREEIKVLLLSAASRA
jgi:small redox-active disulfide protein 2